MSHAAVVKRLRRAGGDGSKSSRVTHGLESVGDLTLLAGAALRGIGRRPFYVGEFLEQCRFVMSACLVPLLLTGIGWGTIVALEAGNFFKLASAEYRVGGFMVLANVREFAPVATGLMVAAVCGTAITADLGARTVRDEVSALEVMGINTTKFLVVPRFLALALMTALYNIPMIAFTCLAGYIASITLVGVNSGGFIATFFTQGTLQDLYGGEIKCIVFGLIVAAVSCYYGLSAKGGAEGVARAVNKSVVVCFVAIQVFEYIWTPTILAIFHTSNVLR